MRIFLPGAPLRIGLLLVLAFVAGSVRLRASSPDQALAPLVTITDANAIMGFETPVAWTPKGDSASGTSAAATTTRTQGRFAYAVMNPSNLTTALTSAPVASTATALAGIGDPGAALQVDLMLPTQLGNTSNLGSMQLFISSRSRKLNNVLVGSVSFKNRRLGIYLTLKFPITDDVRSALAGASFDDLMFQFVVISPGRVTGTYLFDNLRVHSAPLVTADKNTRPPAGYGGSVDLIAIGSTPDATTFDAGIVQVPDDFHLKLGHAGAATVRLELGFDGVPSITCSYLPNADGKSFGQPSCNGGAQAGDLVGASWARLAILGGDSSQKIRAQLAKNPVGDLAGPGIIPPLPTFWGDFDGCTPTLVANQLHPPFGPPSSSCTAQTAQASQIVTDYFNKVNNSNAAPNWIVTPTPEFARRHGDGSPHDIPTGPPPPNDPDFHKDGHVNEGSDWDAYWRLDGSLDAESSDPNSAAPFHNTTHFDATLSGHVVLWGKDVNVASIDVTVESDTGGVTSSGFDQPSVTGCVHKYVFGLQYPESTDCGVPNVGFNVNFGATAETDTGDVQIWIFVVELGATAKVGVDITGGISPVGLDLQVAPQATMGVHASGSVGISGIASGGVDVRSDNLLSVAAPMSALAGWFLTTNPEQCVAKLGFSGAGSADISGGGGDIDLVATFGDCPFCKDVSWKILSWGSIDAYSKPLFGPFTASQTLFPLPISLCTATLAANIQSPVSGTSVPGGSLFPLTLKGSASRPGTPSTGDPSSGVTGIVPDSGLGTIDCKNFAWRVTGGRTDPISGKGCTVKAIFDEPAPATIGQATIDLHVERTVTDQSTRPITETGDATSVMITVLPPTPGPHITKPAQDACDLASCARIATIDTSGVTSIEFAGVVVGAPGPTTTTWTATNVNGGAPIPISGSTQGCTVCTATTAIWTGFPTSGTFTITMTTIDATTHQLFGTDTITLILVQVH
jgi:hypothetical protein